MNTTSQRILPDDAMSGVNALGDSRIGTTLVGKYRLLRLLGVGGTASVYEGLHRNGRRVAIKVLHPSVAGHPQLREQFLREARVANTIEHPGTARVFDEDTTDDGTVFLVMEILHGETLEARDVPLLHDEVAQLAYQLLDALAAVHEKGIVHRDIKPENLFLTCDGTLKILDFGIALFGPNGTPESFSATRVGTITGTPAYLPPEQALGKTNEIDARTDIWGVGATMFWLLSGQHVHHAETLEDLLVSSGSRPARPLASVVDTVPVPLAAVVDQALAFDIAARWPTARAMQEALATAYPEVLTAPPPSGPPPVSRVVVSTGESRLIEPATKTLAGWDPRAGGADATVPPVRISSPPSHRIRPGPRLRPAGVAVLGLLALALGCCVSALRCFRPFVAPPASQAMTLIAPAPSDTLPSGSAVTLVSPAKGVETALEPASSDETPSAPRKPDRHGLPEARPTAAPTAASGPSGDSAPAARRAKTRPAPTLTCAPPYTVDAIGRRIPKAECL